MDREIRQRVKADPVALALEMIPGIGPFIALLLVAEIGDIRRFPTAKHLASYTGLVPSLYASAEHRWGGAITKQGSSLLRWALVQAAHKPSSRLVERMSITVTHVGTSARSPVGCITAYS
ncbi:MAG: transposase [Terriglobia bacterium]